MLYNLRIRVEAKMPSANMCTQRGLIGIAVNEAHCISHRQVAWNRVNWKSDYDEWSWLLFEKSNCEIATFVNVAGWRHWTALAANEFRRLFREGLWERAEKRLGVQARTPPGVLADLDSPGLYGIFIIWLEVLSVKSLIVTAVRTKGYEQATSKM